MQADAVRTQHRVYIYSYRTTFVKLKWKIKGEEHIISHYYIILRYTALLGVIHEINLIVFLCVDFFFFLTFASPSKLQKKLIGHGHPYFIFWYVWLSKWNSVNQKVQRRNEMKVSTIQCNYCMFWNVPRADHWKMLYCIL